MMRILKISAFVLLFCFKSFSQEKKINLIIFFNDELVENVFDFHISTNESLGFLGEYTIGDLAISQMNYDELINPDLQEGKLKFVFTLFKAEKNAIIKSKYQVILDKEFLVKKFIVVRMYDLTNKKFKKKIKRKLLNYDYNIYSDGLYNLNL